MVSNWWPNLMFWQHICLILLVTANFFILGVNFGCFVLNVCPTIGVWYSIGNPLTVSFWCRECFRFCFISQCGLESTHLLKCSFYKTPFKRCPILQSFFLLTLTFPLFFWLATPTPNPPMVRWHLWSAIFKFFRKKFHWSSFSNYRFNQ